MPLAELEEYKDELALLRAWVERDLKDMRYYMADTGKQVASWLGIDIEAFPPGRGIAAFHCRP